MRCVEIFRDSPDCRQPKETPTAYYFSKRLPSGFEETVDRTVEALKGEGFGIITEIDLKETLKKKIDVGLDGDPIAGTVTRFAFRLDPETGLPEDAAVVVTSKQTPSIGAAVLAPVMPDKS